MENTVKTTRTILAVLAIDPVTLEIIAEIDLPEFATGWIPIAIHDGVDYVYMPGVDDVYRYRWENRTLTLDEEWGLVSVKAEGDLSAMAPTVVGD